MLELFHNSTVLVTGHTGFKGSWLSAWLQHLGANVTGVALNPPSKPSHFEATELEELVDDKRIDIREQEALQSIVFDTQPDFIFHLAAQSLVRLSYLNPLETYQTNVFGTLNLLEVLRSLEKPCVAVLITSDKCYDNVEWIWGYRETDRLGGLDPYSASKGATELMISSHVRSFFPVDSNVRIGIGRAGNVVGGGDWADNRIVPDCMRAWSRGENVTLRNPRSTRPWQHVLEPLSGYLTLASGLYENPQLHGEPFNFGPPADQIHSVRELIEAISKHWPDACLEDVSDSPNDSPYESGLLKLNCDKALHSLGWQATLSFTETVRMTAEWYRYYYDNPSLIREKTTAQIREYETLASQRGQAWAL